MHKSIRLLLSAALASCLLAAAAAHSKETTLYIGTYTHGTDSQGIYVYTFDDATGALRPLSIAKGAENPSFLAIHPNGQFLYSADEVDTFDGKKEGAVSAWAIDKDSEQLTILNRQGAGGTGPCHLAVDPSGRYVIAVGYGSGTVAVLPIDAGGQLQKSVTRIEHQGSSVDPTRQTSAHAHQIVFDPNGRFAFVPDLGLDQIVEYRFDDHTGQLTPNDPPFLRTASGAGPRHLALHPNGRRAFGINEIDLTITAYDYDKTRGTLSPRATVSAIDAAADRKGLSGAEIAIHPNGKFLYASVRGTDEIVIYRIDNPEQPLEFVHRFSTGGKTPRNFAIDPTGKWLLAANQNSATITVFHIEDTGKLTTTDQQATVPSPVCLQFLKQ